MTQLIDRESIASIKKIGEIRNKDLLGEMLHIFNAQFNQCLGELNNSIQVADSDNIKYLAHKMKGSCKSIGAEALANKCLEMENLDLADELSYKKNMEALYTQVEKTYESTKEELEIASGAVLAE